MRQIQIIAAAFLLAPLAHAETPAQLETQIKALQATIASQNATIAALQRQVTLIAQNPALGLGPFVTVNPNQELGVREPNITFHGANIHVCSGTGATNDGTGLGNMIIGADEYPPQFVAGDRSGSNNLIVGIGNRFKQTAFGGVVFGQYNFLSGAENTILRGCGNYADGTQNVSCGGADNEAFGTYDVLVSGSGSLVLGVTNVIVGGSGNGSTILGGSGLSETGDKLTWASAITVQ